MKWDGYSRQKKIAKGMASWEDSEALTGMLETWGGGVEMKGEHVASRGYMPS